MIQFPAKHLFEAKFPMLEDDEEEIFFEHPRWSGVKCNQIGIVYYDETIYTYTSSAGLYIYRTRKLPYATLGNKSTVCYECYYGGIWKGKQFYHVNGNPYDHSCDNLIPTSDYKNPRIEEARRNKKMFIQKTLQHLVRLENKFEKEGMSKQELYAALMLPAWLIAARKTFKDGKVTYNREKKSKKSETKFNI